MTLDGNYFAKIGGWVLSVLLHAIGIGTAMVLAAEFSILPREKPFQWDVSLVAATHPEPITSDLPTPVPAASTRRRVTPEIGSRRSNPPDTASHKTIIASSPIGAAPSALPSHELPRAHSSERVSLRKNKTVNETQLPQDIAPPEPLTPHEEPSDTSPEPTAVLPVEEPITGEMPPPQVDSSEHSFLTSEPSIQEPLQVANRPRPQYRDPIVSQTLQADHRWLAEVLFKKIEQLKRYPHAARTHRWEGNVVLQAIIREDGRVGDITVVESSGHPMLDHEAIALLERTSPIALKHPLGQPHIVVQLPIGYRLE
jgi:protein TonB